MDALTREELPIDFDPRWLAVLRQMKEQFGKKPELEAVLFLIGMNELGYCQNSPKKKSRI